MRQESCVVNKTNLRLGASISRIIWCHKVYNLHVEDVGVYWIKIIFLENEHSLLFRLTYPKFLHPEYSVFQYSVMINITKVSLCSTFKVILGCTLKFSIFYSTPIYLGWNIFIDSYFGIWYRKVILEVIWRKISINLLPLCKF